MRLVVAVLCAVMVATVYASIQASPPTFPQSFTVYEADATATYQGDYTSSNNGICCGVNSNCEIETQAQAGLNYVDAVNQRARANVDGTGQYIVTFCGKIQKECLVQNGVCQSYCPLQDEEIGGFGPDPNSTLAGTVVINGQTAQVWQYQDTFIGIVMETDQFVLFPGDAPVPVAEYDFLTPFGQAIGSSNSSWSQWSPGVPAASLFEVSGLDNCPEDSNCNSNARQLNRRRLRHKRTYYYYKYGPETVKPRN